MVCQILSPLIFNMLPLVYIVTTLFLGVSDPRLSIVLNLGFSWIPFINSFTTIYFVLPYKQGAKEILFGKCFNANETR
uniref:Uncharacterized protein n=1 Tax=Acrobeloides nanus TaxID=290746 RepID=A0A914CIW2_9BILA